MQNQTEQRMLIGAFDKNEADKLYDELKEEGYSNEEISVITSKDAIDHNFDKAKKGGAIGGVLGLLVGAGLITVPGVGAVLAVGPLVELLGGAIGGAVTGGLTGGIIGALVDIGIDKDLAEQYQNAIKNGKTVIAVPVNENHKRTHIHNLFRKHMGEKTKVLEPQPTN